jgi:hypothetical protein
MKIGFYGDSFCNEINNPHSIFYKYDTYIKKLKKHFDADITHLGSGGSSHWDLIIEQFSLNTELPDYCIFCWTDYARLYNKKVRDLTYNSVLDAKTKDWKFHKLMHPMIHKAADLYFKYLYDDKKSRLEYISALAYFDSCILSQVIDRTKVIHLWSFDNFGHKWKNGLTITNNLNSVSVIENELPGAGFGPNHFGDSNKNQIVFKWLVHAIENYKSGAEISFPSPDQISK